MKYTNWIKLLSVLLCALMLCTACAAPERKPSASIEDVVPVAPYTPMLEEVGAKLGNFFGISDAEGREPLSSATRLDGEMVEGNQLLLVLRTAKIDHLNRVTETFTVYNTELQTQVLTVSNTYEYCEYHYSEFDWDGYYYNDPDLKFPKSIVKVEAAYYMDIPYIKVSRAKVTAVDEATYTLNEGNSHVVDITYDYYDVAGTEIVTGAKKDYVAYADENVVSFVNVVATFDPATYKMISKVTADNSVVRYNYTSETADYGYYLNCTQYSALGSRESFFEVYNKKDGSLVLRYYLDSSKGYGRAFMMAGGDVLVQYARSVDKDKNEEHNLEYDGEYLMTESYLVDVPTGAATKMKLDHILYEVYTADDFAEEYGIGKKGITLTENTANIAFGYDTSKGKLDEKLDLFVLNNDGSVMFKMDRIVPEHVFGEGNNPLGYTQLPDGNYLVDIALLEKIGNEDVTRAIVSADGKVRSYLTDSAIVVGKYVVYEQGVYDYDMKLKFDISITDDYELVGVVGDYILISRYDEEDGTVYYRLSATDDSLDLTQVFNGKQIVSVEKDYVIACDNETGKYSLCNAELEHVLTTLNEMYVILCDEKYMVGTELTVEGKAVRIFYAIG